MYIDHVGRIRGKKGKKSTPVGLEPTRENPIDFGVEFFLVNRLNHSAMVSQTTIDHQFRI